MENFFEQYMKVETDSVTDPAYTVVRGDVRFSVLTDRLLRVEWDKEAYFTDEPTQKVWFRNFNRPSFQVKELGDIVRIQTEKTIFEYDSKKNQMESITLADGKVVTDFQKGNLKGTCRTLDNSFGKRKLEDGLVSLQGVSVLDDTDSLLIAEDGSIEVRKKTEKDEYYFAFGQDYRECIRTLYALCGESPLVPRYCLGNWWSRYKAYSQEEYISLMEQFLERKIPITVATIDMDWHWVDVVERFGEEARFQQGKKRQRMSWSDGWTGYSWNTELFPDYRGFLKWLKDHHFMVTLNVHPGQGVRPFEDQYEEFAKRVGVDPATKQHIPFDITDQKYIEAYFDVLHRPYEEEGVDFWWIDWQQGTETEIENFDPLWALNHYHYLYAGKNHKRPLILSRYAQIGSHRYPLGFSGDTGVNWKVLAFQPYFTVNAANVGYTWWSHDIGGHFIGTRDDEMYLRWVQFGVFSPILRLHSTNNEFSGKEPWKYRKDVCDYATEYLRLRHRLIPYLYTMNERNHSEGIALCEPLYYQYPKKKNAYRYPNEYFFGSELIAAPITEKINPKTNLAKVEVWLPAGRYTDIFNGQIYEGGRTYVMYRGLESIPVLAHAGAIVPLDRNEYENDWSNPQSLELLIYRGNGQFDLYEDDGETDAYKAGVTAVTTYTVRENVKTAENDLSLTFRIQPVRGDVSVVPQKRNYLLSFKDISFCEKVVIRRTKNGEGVVGEVVLSEPELSESGQVIRDGLGRPCEKIKTVSAYAGRRKYLTVEIADVEPEENVQVELVGCRALENQNTREALVETISRFQSQMELKFARYTKYIEDPTLPVPFREPYKGVIEEILSLKR